MMTSLNIINSLYVEYAQLEVRTYFGRSGNIVALSCSRRRSSSGQRVDAPSSLEYEP